MKLELTIALDDNSYDSSKKFSFEIPYDVRDDDIENKLIDLLNTAVNWNDVVAGLCLEVQAKMPASQEVMMQQTMTLEQLKAAQIGATPEELADIQKNGRKEERK